LPSIQHAAICPYFAILIENGHTIRVISNWSDISLGWFVVLKVAHKVVLGFGIILLLLLIASISSIGILGNIEEATGQVDEFAIPVQNHSNAIQIQLLKQGQTSALISSSSSVEAIEQLKSKFQQDGAKLQGHFKKISVLLAKRAAINHIKTFNVNYLNYTDAVNKMLVYKMAELSQTTKLLNHQTELDTYLDEADALLVDLSYLEDPDKQNQIDRIIGAAGQIEGYMINLTEAVKQILSLNSIEEVEISKETIELAIGNIDNLLKFLVTLGEEYDTDGIIEQFVEQFNLSKEKLTGEENLFDLKITQLEQASLLIQFFTQSKSDIDQSVNSIDELLTVVNQNLGDLQLAVFDHVEQGKTTTLVILLILFIAGIAIAYTTIRAMIGPLTRINNVLSYIAKGDLSRKLSVKADDEYGELSKNVNLVVEDLRTLIAEISQNTGLLNVAAEQSSEELEQVSHTLDEQKETVIQVTEITQALDLSATNILEKATDAEQQMDSALKQSDELEGIANTTNDRMATLVEMLNDTSGVMTILQQESINISSILETIRGISDQTNLLALNAAIEAARAGEAGRGFAVVADEVRLLASRTQESAAEITTMIDSLQEKSTQAVADIAKGKTEANNCQQHTDQLLQTLVLITQAIDQMYKMSQEIAESATQQNSLSHDINEKMHNVSHLSEQSSEKSSSTKIYSQQVGELAEKLDVAVDAFKV